MAPAGPGAFFSFAAFVLLLLCSLSTPLIKQSTSPFPALVVRSFLSAVRMDLEGRKSDVTVLSLTYPPVYFLRADVVGEVLTASVSGEARFGTFGWCTSAIGVKCVFSSPSATSFDATALC